MLDVRVAVAVSGGDRGVKKPLRVLLLVSCRCRDGVSATADQHHWVEVTCLPSMQTFVCDPSYDDGGRVPLTPMLQSYSLDSDTSCCLYPNGQRLSFQL